jgi:hypothetical protein
MRKFSSQIREEIYFAAPSPLFSFSVFDALPAGMFSALQPGN